MSKISDKSCRTFYPLLLMKMPEICQEIISVLVLDKG